MELHASCERDVEFDKKQGKVYMLLYVVCDYFYGCYVELTEMSLVSPEDTHVFVCHPIMYLVYG